MSRDWTPRNTLITWDVDPPRGSPREIIKDMFGCGHCNEQVAVKPFCDPAEAGGLCHRCNRLICSGCVERDICVPLEEYLAALEGQIRLNEARRRFLRDLGHL